VTRDAIDLYLDDFGRSASDSSVEKYRYVLDKFADHVGSEVDLREVTPMHCREFLARWSKSAKATQALHITILNRFFEFWFDEEEIQANPMARIKRPKLPPPEELDVTTIATSDVDRLYAAAREWDEILCLALLSYLGPRRTAAANLRLRDIDFERGTVRFREKGGKVITKPAPDELLAILREADDAGVWAPSRFPDAYVIPNRRAPRNEQRSSKIIYAIVKRIGERAGVDVHPHALRAAFAVHYLDQHDGDTYGLQKLMGHTRPETTQVYLRRHDDFKAMEKVRGLRWGGGALRELAGAAA